MGMAAAMLLLAGCGRPKETPAPELSSPVPAATEEASQPESEPTGTPTESADIPPEVTEAPEDTGAVWTLTQHADTSGLQCMFYTLHNEEDGYLIVIDGGNPENEAHVRDVIRENGGVVNAWFVTHFHKDHASVFNAVYADPGDISIENVYTTNLDRDIFYSVAHEWDTPETFDAFLQLAENAPDIKRLHADDEFELDGLTVEVFNAGDPGREELYGDDIPNNCSLVMKISGRKDSLLILGDAHTDTLGSFLIANYGDRLKAEYVQTGHHGTNSFPTSFYDAVGGRTAFFDSPSWVMTEEKYTADELEVYFHERGAVTYDFRTAPNAFLFE